MSREKVKPRLLLITFLSLVSEEHNSLKPLHNMKEDYEKLSSGIKTLEGLKEKLSELLKTKDAKQIELFD